MPPPARRRGRGKIVRGSPLAAPYGRLGDEDGALANGCSLDETGRLLYPRSLVSEEESRGALPVLTTCLGSRTELVGLKARTWPTTSQSKSMRCAGRCCLPLGAERRRPPWART